MLKLILEVIKIVNSETEPRQISLAVCFSLIAGFAPLVSLPTLFAAFLVFTLRVNLATFLLLWPLVAAIAYLVDPLLHRIGWAALTATPLAEFWTTCYNITFLRLLRFNNTVVMGGLLTALALFVPCFFAVNYGVRTYRETILAWVEKTKVIKLIKASRLFEIYQSVAGTGGAI